MTPQEKNILILEMERTAFDVRGKVLHLVIRLEKAMDIFLTEYFTDNIVKQEELMCLILSPQLNLTPKKDIFCYLIKKHRPNVVTDIPQLLPSLSKIIDERNLFAHRPLSFTDESIERFKSDKTLVFLKLRQTQIDGVSTLITAQFYSKKRIDALIKIINICIIEIDKLLKHDAPL